MSEGVVAQIDLGHAIESFMEDKLGQFLLERAAGEAISAIDALKQTSPEDANEIRRLQNIIQRAEGFEMWLIEGLQQGQAMEVQLELSQAPD